MKTTRQFPELTPLLPRMSESERETLRITLESHNHETDARGFVKIRPFFGATSQTVLSGEEISEAMALMLGKVAFYISEFTFLTSDSYSSLESHPTVRAHVAIGWLHQADMRRARDSLVHLKALPRDPYFMAEVKAIEGFIHSVRRDLDATKTAERAIRKLAEDDEAIVSHVLPLVVIRRVYLQRRTRQQVDNGIEELRDLINELNSVRHRFFLAKAHLRLGQLHSNIGALNEALMHYKEALTRAIDLDSPHLQSIIKNRLGMLLSEREQLEDAKHAFLEAVALARRCKARWLEAAPLLNLSQFFWNKDNPELVLRTVELFLSIAMRMEDPQDTVVALNILAHLHGMMGHTDAAISYMLRAMELKKRLRR